MPLSMHWRFGRAIARPSIEAMPGRASTPSTRWFGRAIARPSIEATLAGAGEVAGNAGSAGQLPGPPLKLGVHVGGVGVAGRSAGQLPGPPLKQPVAGSLLRDLQLFGRAIARPSIEATSTGWWREPAQACSAGQLPGPPLKRRPRLRRARRTRLFGRAIARPSIEADRPHTSKRNRPTGSAGQLPGPPLKHESAVSWPMSLHVEFGRAIARPSIEARSRCGYATRGRRVRPGNCPALH